MGLAFTCVHHGLGVYMCPPWAWRLHVSTMGLGFTCVHHGLGVYVCPPWAWGLRVSTMGLAFTCVHHGLGVLCSGLSALDPVYDGQT